MEIGNNEAVNNATSSFYVNKYRTEKVSNQEEFHVEKEELSEPKSKFLGMGFLKEPNSIYSYGMSAYYADDYSNDNPVIRVVLEKNGGREEYKIDIRKVNPFHATEIEMFALCNYADATGMGTGGTFGSWQTLNYYRYNASGNGYFEMTNTTDAFHTVKQNWAFMVSSMIADYTKAGLYKQVLDGNKLLGIFDLLGFR